MSSPERSSESPAPGAEGSVPAAPADFSEEGLRQLRQLFDDSGAEEVVEALVADLARQHQQIGQALNGGPSKLLQLVAHTLKGNCRLLHAVELADFCEALETLIGQGAVEEAQRRLPEMMRRYEALISHAQRVLQGQR